MKGPCRKVVDAGVGRRELAEAVWRVILRDGVEGASVREVAAEAGLSSGSLKHYFGSQSRCAACGTVPPSGVRAGR